MSEAWYPATPDWGWSRAYRPVFDRLRQEYRWETLAPAVVLRDANATAGTWPEMVRLEFEPMWLSWDEGHLYVIPPEEVLPEDLLVPLFAGDPERATWTRRRWWGRGPIRPMSGWGICTYKCDRHWCSNRLLDTAGCVPF